MSTPFSTLIPNPTRLHSADLQSSTFSSPTSLPSPPFGYQTITEGAAVALYQSGKVFYNRVQIFNRDLSVLAIRAWDERRIEEAKKNPKFARKAWAGRGEWPSSSSSTSSSSSSTSSSSLTTNHQDNAILPPIRILEALAASGLRTMRYARELPKGRVSLIVANDLEAAAIDAIALNVKFNGLDTDNNNSSDLLSDGAKVLGNSKDQTEQGTSAATSKPHQPSTSNHSRNLPRIVGNAGDASLVMLCTSRGIALPGTMQNWLKTQSTSHSTSSKIPSKESSSSTSSSTTSSSPSPFLFDVVDLDPYGTASPFLDSALQAVSEGGLLCVTCTDMAVLAGNHMDVCHSKYGSIPVKARHYNEQALRIVLACIETNANKHRKSITPLLSISVDFYVRVFVTVHSSAQACNEAPVRLANIHQCTGCDSHWFWPLGKGAGKGKGLWKPLLLKHSSSNSTLDVAASLNTYANEDNTEMKTSDNLSIQQSTTKPSASSSSSFIKDQKVNHHDSAMVDDVDSTLAVADNTMTEESTISRRDQKKRTRAANKSAYAASAAAAAAATPFRQRLVTANTAPDLPCDCPHCGRSVVVGGPLWLDPIHDVGFVNAVSELGEACFGNDGLGPASLSSTTDTTEKESTTIQSNVDKAGPTAQYYYLRSEHSSFEEFEDKGDSQSLIQTFDSSRDKAVNKLAIPRPEHDGGSNDVQTVSSSRRRLLGVLRSAQEETERVPDVPLYYDLSSLSKTLHTSTISLPNMHAALLNAGYRVGASHCAPNVVKTDAPPVVIIDIMREWARQNGISPTVPLQNEISTSNTSVSNSASPKKLSSYATAAEAILSIHRQSTASELPLISSPGVYSSPAEAERIVGASAAAWWKKPEALKESLRLRKEKMASGSGQRFIPNPSGQWGPMARAHGGGGGGGGEDEGNSEKRSRTEEEK